MKSRRLELKVDLCGAVCRDHVTGCKTYMDKYVMYLV